jgi:hypothetical protein
MYALSHMGGKLTLGLLEPPKYEDAGRDVADRLDGHHSPILSISPRHELNWVAAEAIARKKPVNAKALKKRPVRVANQTTRRIAASL